jgi:hypothetical protein
MTHRCGGAPLLGLLLALLAASPARARDEAPVGSAVTTEAVLELVRADKLAQGMELAAASKGALERPEAEPRARRLALVWAVLRAASLSLEGRDDEREVRHALALAAERALPEDLALLRETATVSERAAPYARLVARGATGKIAASSDPSLLLAFLRGDDEDAKRRAIVALGERLGTIRAKVETGNDLDLAEQRELADPALLDALIDELGARQKAADDLAHDLAASATASPLHVLALIEAPAISALEAARRRGAVGADEALAAVLAAARERVRRFPRSTWSSARGLMPRAIPDALPCASCQRPLPQGARFCPACGAASSGAPCARCGETTLHEVCPRCGASAAARAPSRVCEKCGETLGEGDGFCRRCGTPAGHGVPVADPLLPAAEAPGVERPAVREKR